MTSRSRWSSSGRNLKSQTGEKAVWENPGTPTEVTIVPVAGPAESQCRNSWNSMVMLPADGRIRSSGAATEPHSNPENASGPHAWKTAFGAAALAAADASTAATTAGVTNAQIHLLIDVT